MQEGGLAFLVQAGVEEHGIREEVRIEANALAVFNHQTRCLKRFHILANLQRLAAKDLGCVIEQGICFGSGGNERQEAHDPIQPLASGLRLPVQEVFFEALEHPFAKRFLAFHCFRPSSRVDQRTAQYNQQRATVRQRRQPRRLRAMLADPELPRPACGCLPISNAAGGEALRVSRHNRSCRAGSEAPQGPEGVWPPTSGPISRLPLLGRRLPWRHPAGGHRPLSEASSALHARESRSARPSTHGG